MTCTSCEKTTFYLVYQWQADIGGPPGAAVPGPHPRGGDGVCGVEQRRGHPAAESARQGG